MSTDPIISIQGLSKTYASGFQALKHIDLDIHRGEIFALLGPNGAGKTTLISIICGLATPSSGSVTIAGADIQQDYRAARAVVGLVPQELTTDSFEQVIHTVRFSRGLFGKKPDEAHIERVLRALSLWDKRHTPIRRLSGGMKRRVLIAKALSHEPAVLFLDEPTAGVDVALRQDMWQLVSQLRDTGVTVILTTHYIEEAEQMADRVGIIDHGELVLVEAKQTLMQRMGGKRLRLRLAEPLAALPAALADLPLALTEQGQVLEYSYDMHATSTVAPLFTRLQQAGIGFIDVQTSEQSLEEIFVSLVS